MQTFLPWPDAFASAACLDGKRLGKQITEGYQVMKCLTGDGSSSWNSHPIVAAWRGCEGALMSYLNAMHGTWQSRRGSTARHAAYVAERIGVQHVGLGSDFDGAMIPDELGDVAGVPRLFDALAKAGFSAAELDAIAWDNWRRVLGDWWRA